METPSTQKQFFDEMESLKVIREMIRISRRRLENNGILFIIWGWIMFITYLSDILRNRLVLTFTMGEIFRYGGLVLLIGGIVFTVYYIFFRKKQLSTHIEKSLLIVWLAWLIARIFINLILFNFTGQAEFALQNPIFMVLTAFALVATAGILRYKLLLAAGILFGVAALGCSYLAIETQQIITSLAWLICFVLPGHLLYSNRNKKLHV